MRKLVASSKNRHPLAVEEGALTLESRTKPTRKDKVVDVRLDDEETSHDYDSLGSLPKGEISRRIRRFGQQRRIASRDPRGVGQSSNQQSLGVSSSSSSSTVRRAAVAIDPRRRLRREVRSRDPPTQTSDNSSRVSEDHRFGEESRDDFEHDDGSGYLWANTEGSRNEGRTHRASQRDFGGQRNSSDWPGDAKASSSSKLSNELSEELEREFGVQPYPNGNVLAGSRSRMFPPRAPAREGERPAGPQRIPKELVRTQSLPHNSHQIPTFSSRSSSMSSSAPEYSPEDSTYLLYGYADWAELPTQQNDLELQRIRQRFLRNSSLSSDLSQTDNKAQRSKHFQQKYSDKEPLDTEGLPSGFYRRNDGVIQSFGSSNDSSSRRYMRYISRTTGDSDMEKREEKSEVIHAGKDDRSVDPEKSIDSTKYGTPMAWIPDANSIVDNTATETNDDPTHQTSNIESTVQTKEDLKKENGLVSAFVHSFEERINEFRTGISKRHDGENQRQATKVRDESISSGASTPSSIRRAKVKSSIIPAGRTSLQSGRHQRQHVPAGWGFDPDGHQSFSESEGYDDSTITSRESRMPRTHTIVDVSRIRDEERPEYLEPYKSLSPIPASGDPQHPIDIRESRIIEQTGRYEDDQNDRDVSRPGVDRYDRSEDIDGRLPERTRRGDQVPDLVPAKDNPLAPSIVSDISSLPRSNDFHRNFIESGSLNGYGGFSIDDNVTGFIDKLALALRLAVFQPNGCR